MGGGCPGRGTLVSKVTETWREGTFRKLQEVSITQTKNSKREVGEGRGPRGKGLLTAVQVPVLSD